MKKILSILLAFTIMLSGCATASGFYRTAKVRNVPAAHQLEAFLRSYPGIAKVEVVANTSEQTPHGMHYFYTGIAPHTCGYITFQSKDGIKYKYAGYLVSLNGALPQELADASWAFMHKLENDMRREFNIIGIDRTIGTVNRVQHPERATK